MIGYYWKDLFDRNDDWQGLELTVSMNLGGSQAMEMLSGSHGRMALQVAGKTLFWATMLNDHSGIWLVFNTNHSDGQTLIPPVTSKDIEKVISKAELARTKEWSRYFSRKLMNTSLSLLTAKRWLIRPMEIKHQSPLSKISDTVKNWRFYSPQSTGNIGFSWNLYGEDFPDLVDPNKVRLVDWWWGGNLLLGRYAIQPNTGRLKWWRKKCREGSLPPILVWYVAGLGSYVILDGHYRLQAAIEEEIPPSFLVLSELHEQDLASDQNHQERVVRGLEKQLKSPKCNLDGVNQTLINLYDTRYIYASTHSRATLGEGTQWIQEVENYLQQHQLENYRDRIINRIDSQL
ncbi:ParB/Srx family N-terminal domain-containing protein [Candidatus Pantoea formicae]|uniref:ParB/Srx family N-terminal domain-containing protein n=1 Tax=Candidatus Pantoea formicae TaxID=2608355 RepID=UPI003ED91356